MKRLRASYVAVIFCIYAITLIPLLSSPQNGKSILEELHHVEPRCAAINQTCTFPESGGKLVVGDAYNLTASLRDDDAFARAYTGGYLTINKGGSLYSNQDFLPTGSFNASFSFQDDPIGGPAAGWSYDSGGTYSVVSSFLGHSKVQKETGVSAWKGMSTTISAQTQLSCEFWLSTDGLPGPASQTIEILWKDAGGAIGPYLGIENTGGVVYFARYKLGTGWTTFHTPVAINRWYHVRVTMNTATDKFDLWLDGVKVVTSGDFYQPCGAITSFKASIYASGVSMYLDAVDFSSTVGYVAGRSAIDVSPIGTYNSTFSFETDTIFSTPAGWTTSAPASTYVQVTPCAPNVGNYHKNVLRLLDESSSVGCSAYYHPPSAISEGRVEFWAYPIGSSGNAMLLYDAGAHELFNIYMGSGGSYYFYTNPGSIYLGAFPNVWTHFSVYFNTITDQCAIWVNEQKVVPLRALTTAGNAVTYLGPATGSDPADFYIDAVDISTDPQYLVNRSTFTILQQNYKFPLTGEYSFRYTLNASGTNYYGTWTDFTVNTTTPSAPQALVATNASKRVDLSWQPPAWSGKSPITNYNIYRGESSGSEILNTTLGNVTSFSDTGANNYSKTYFYQVSAINSYGEGEFSSEVYGTPQRTPSAPKFLNVVNAVGRVELFWVPPDSNGSSYVTNYTVFRGTVSEGETFYAVLNDTFFIDTGATDWELTYYYKIGANNSYGLGEMSNESSGGPHPPPAITPIGNFVIDSWAQAGNFNATYTFDGETPGNPPANFDLTDTGYDCSCQVAETFDNHSKVLRFYDYATGQLCSAKVQFTGKTAGIVECYMAVNTTGPNDYLLIEIRNDIYIAARLILTSSALCWAKLTTPIKPNLVQGRFYHIRVAFDCTTSTNRIWFNGTEVLNSTAPGSPWNFITGPLVGGVSMVTFQTNGGNDAGPYLGYVDALDFNWTAGYVSQRSFPHFTWNISYADPLIELNYTILRNGTFMTSGAGIYAGDSISVPVGTLTGSEINFTINVTDKFYWRLNWTIVVYNKRPCINPTTSLLNYTYGSTDNAIAWNVTDKDACDPRYTIYEDGRIWGTGNNAWVPDSSIVTNVDGLYFGYHNFSIVVTDGYGGVNSSWILVLVSDVYTNSTWQRVYYGRSWVQCDRWTVVWAELEMKVVCPWVEIRVTTYLPGSFPIPKVDAIGYFRVEVDGDLSSVSFPMPGRFYYDSTKLGSSVVEEDLALYHWDGKTWVMMESFVNPIKDYILIDYMPGDYVIAPRPLTIDITEMVIVLGSCAAAGVIFAILWSRRVALMTLRRRMSLAKLEGQVKEILGL